MIRTFGRKSLAAALAVAVGLVAPHASGVSVSVATVGAYAPNPNALVVADAASNSAAGGITLANFQTLVSGAFAANRGGVINAEPSGTWVPNQTNYGDGAANPISATYGVAQSNTLNFYRTDVDANLVPFGINGNTNNGTNVLSGTAYIGSPSNGAWNMVFTSGLSALGLSEIQRGAGRIVTLIAKLDDASLITGTTTTLNAGGTADNNPGAIFWGFQAPATRTIVGLEIRMTDLAGAPAFARFDDLGFVVAIPEPATLSLGGLAAFGLLARRRRA